MSVSFARKPLVRPATAALRWRSLLGALATALLLGVAPKTFAAGPWRVVILQGADPSQPAAAQQDRAFRRALEEAAPDGVEFYTDSLDGLRFQGGDLMPEFLALLSKKYRSHEVDLVVGLAEFALDFAERYHAQLWPDKPVLILSVEEQRLRRRGLPATFAHMPLRIDVEGTLAIAEALQPAAQRLVVVAGVTPFDRYWSERAVAVARQRESRRWAVESWSGLPLEELKSRLATLDRNTAVLYTTMYRDREGRSYFPFELVKPMAEASGAPIYGWYPTYLEPGLTAGSFISFENNGRRAGELAASILRGETHAAGASLPPMPSRCIAHAGQLEAHGLDAQALPEACQLAYAPPSLWRTYRWHALITLTIVGLQALSITALLVHRRRRRAAEEEASQRRIELHRAARLATAGELSASIAHEVGQPLGAIVTNTEAAQLILGSDRPDHDELQNIFADVRRDALRANEVVQRLRALLQKQPTNFLVLNLKATLEQALGLLGPESRRRGVSIEFNAASEASIMGDRVQIQQIMLNLAINAMDAMRDTPPAQRLLSVSLLSVEAGFEIRVADAGHGFPVADQARLFDSFYTTKTHGMGLGLSIVRTMVQAHGGRVCAMSRPEGGSLFIVSLPRPQATSRQAEAPPQVSVQGREARA